MKREIEITEGMMIWATFFFVVTIIAIGMMLDDHNKHNETMARIQNHCQEPEKAK